MSEQKREVTPPALRTFTKEEMKSREQKIKITNSEVSADKVDIVAAVDRAIERMQAHIDSYKDSTTAE